MRLKYNAIGVLLYDDRRVASESVWLAECSSVVRQK